MPSLLSIIVPTYNEAGALPLLVRRVHAALSTVNQPYELLIVDDSSPDGTGALAEQMTAEYPSIRVVHRPRKAGLAAAVLDGIQHARGTLIGVMDADLSHPPEALPAMVRAIDEQGYDLAVGSRYVRGGGIEDWPKRRQVVSVVANLFTRWLTPVKDATSGFFIIRRSALDGVELNPIGFKIGLEVMARARYQRWIEVPYVFTDRKHGSSKFGSREVRLFLEQLAILYGERFRRVPAPTATATPADKR